MEGNKLFDHDFSEDVGNLLFGYGEFSDNMSLISPDNTSDGQLIKKWKIADGKRVLIKGGSNPYQQEPLCEVIASGIAERLCIPHTKYTLLWEHEKPFSVCRISLLLKRNWYQHTISCRAERSQMISRTMNFI